MGRKQWTARTELTASLSKLREKRKWQLALRRYVIERSYSPLYASYFGLPILQMREWIELQFIHEQVWANFAVAWQLDHIVPPSYFNFSQEGDLLLCWNFINIRVVRAGQHDAIENRIDVIIAKSYFQALYDATGYVMCLKMVERIIKMEESIQVNQNTIADFITSRKSYLDMVSTLSKDEFNRLNYGITIESLLLERDILKKFG